MTTLESVIRHDLRLDILGSLAFGGPCGTTELCKRAGLQMTGVEYHLAVLRTERLVERDAENGLYAASLDDHPAWVEAAVTAHQLAKGLSLQLPSSVMHGLTCDHCERLFRYKEKAVAVYDDGRTMRAKVVIEETPGSGEADELGARSKYHVACYEKEERNLPLPPVEPGQ